MYLTFIRKIMHIFLVSLRSTKMKEDSREKKEKKMKEEKLKYRVKEFIFFRRSVFFFYKEVLKKQFF